MEIEIEGVAGEELVAGNLLVHLVSGMNYILDRDKLVTRKKAIPGDAAASPLYKRVAAGKMPPPSEKVRPSEADVTVRVDLGLGAGTARVWTCDLTQGYIAINGDYRS